MHIVLEGKTIFIFVFDKDDKEILKNGTVDFFTFSYYSTGCVTTDKNLEKNKW